LTEAESSKFKLSWNVWVAELTRLGGLATTPDERALVLRVKQVLENTDLVAQLCHDIKDPLASMVMGLALLEKAHKGEAVIDTITSAGRRLDRVVMAAHDLALLRRGEYGVRLLSLPLASLVTTVIEKSRKSTPRNIRVDLVIAANLPNVVGDTIAVSRVIQELLDNAIAFSDDGGVVDVHVSAVGEQVAVVVTDRGQGIDAAHLPHVFDEARNRAHRPRRGAGRGLPIAHALAELQGASLTIGQCAPKGCEATLRMRVA
jgi:signal transduction histidine kinase